MLVLLISLVLNLMISLAISLAITILSPFMHLAAYLYQSHVYMICELFDPVKDGSFTFSKFSTGNVHFVFPLVYFVSTQLFGLFGLDHESCDSI